MGVCCMFQLRACIRILTNCCTLFAAFLCFECALPIQFTYIYGSLGDKSKAFCVAIKPPIKPPFNRSGNFSNSLRNETGAIYCIHTKRVRYNHNGWFNKNKRMKSDSEWKKCLHHNKRCLKLNNHNTQSARIKDEMQSNVVWKRRRRIQLPSRKAVVTTQQSHPKIKHIKISQNARFWRVGTMTKVGTSANCEDRTSHWGTFH